MRIEILAQVADSAASDIPVPFSHSYSTLKVIGSLIGSRRSTHQMPEGHTPTLSFPQAVASLRSVGGHSGFGNRL